MVGDVIEERNTRDWVIKDVAVCPGRDQKSLVMPSGSLSPLFSFCANFVFVSTSSGFVKRNRHQVRKENEKRQKWHVGAPEWLSWWGWISVGANATVSMEKSRLNESERVFLLASSHLLGGGARNSYRGGRGARLWIGLDVWRFQACLLLVQVKTTPHRSSFVLTVTPFYAHSLQFRPHHS